MEWLFLLIGLSLGFLIGFSVHIEAQRDYKKYKKWYEEVLTQLEE